MVIFHSLVLDTETTGFPKQWKITPNNTNTANWYNARVIEIAWIISDNNGNVVKKENYIIKPIGEFNITPMNQLIHGFSKEQVLANGYDMESILIKMKKDVEIYNVNTIIAHNYEFDSNVILSEIYRLSNTSYTSIFERNKYCTMLNGTSITKLMPYRFGNYKYPKLPELCLHYDIEFDPNMAHGALYDTEKTIECYMKMI
jgi:DNA polymerase III epsilon subunit-like protein